MSSIKASKQALRKEIAAKIQQLTNEEKCRQTDKVLEKVDTLLYYIYAYAHNNRLILHY